MNNKRIIFLAEKIANLVRFEQIARIASKISLDLFRASGRRRISLHKVAFKVTRTITKPGRYELNLKEDECAEIKYKKLDIIVQGRAEFYIHANDIDWVSGTFAQGEMNMDGNYKNFTGQFKQDGISLDCWPCTQCILEFNPSRNNT